MFLGKIYLDGALRELNLHAFPVGKMLPIKGASDIMSPVRGIISALHGLVPSLFLIHCAGAGGAKPVAGKEPRFFLVQEDILPEAIYKTVQAKELLMRGEVATVNEAVERVQLSRSAFYKYKDKVYPFNRWNRDQTVILEVMLEHRSGILSAVLSNIAAVGGNIVTINQNIPQQGVAVATLTIETRNLNCDVEKMLVLLRSTIGVKKAELVGA